VLAAVESEDALRSDEYPSILRYSKIPGAYDVAEYSGIQYNSHTAMTRLSRSTFLVAGTLALAGCDGNTTNLESTAPVSVRLELTGVGAAKAAADEPLELVGDDGTLSISDVRFILDSFSLAVSQDVCEESGCPPIEAGPVFVDVPLDLESLELFVAEVPLGSYSALEFAITGLGSEDASLAAAIHNDFPNWPDAASAVVVGSFAPLDGSPARPFTIYIGADVDVSLRVDPPFELTEEHVEKALTLGLDVLSWLPDIPHNIDISGYDYDTTGEVIPFVLELDKAFSVKHD
jgi:hypothetical protein